MRSLVRQCKAVFSEQSAAHISSETVDGLTFRCIHLYFERCDRNSCLRRQTLDKATRFAEKIR